jgi:Uma2 family endonuclease
MAVAQSEVTLEDFTAFDAAAPEGLHLELINGRVLVTPPPDGDHGENVVFLRKQFEAHDPGLVLYHERGLVEVTSGGEKDADVDRVEKRDAYAQAALPVYLLVDRHRGEAVVHWEPEGGRYQHSQKAVFGAKLGLPEPFGFDLDTSDLA